MVLEGGVLPPPLRLYAAAAAAASNGGCFAPSPVLPPHSLFPHFATRFPLQSFAGIPPSFLHHQTHQGQLRFAANLLGRTNNQQDIRNEVARRRQRTHNSSGDADSVSEGTSPKKGIEPLTYKLQFCIHVH